MPVVTRRPAGTPCWIDLTSSKPEETKAFYSALFGWTFHDSGPEFGHYHLVQKGSRVVAGFMPHDAQMAGMPSVWTNYYASDNVQADMARITELGGHVVVPAMQVHNRGWMMVATDPTGAAFGMWQPLEFQGIELDGEHGTLGWQEVLTRDTDAAKTFYTTLFGASSQRLEGEMKYFTMQKGEYSIGGIMQMDDAHWPPEVPPHWMMYLIADYMPQALETVTTKGGQVLVTPFDTPFGKISVVSDPSGASFSLLQLPISRDND